MTSEIRTNSLTSRAGLSTVTMTDSGPMFSGITTFVDNSGFTFGVGAGSSIFTPAANTLTLGTNSLERLRIDSSGRVLIGDDSNNSSSKVGDSALQVYIQDRKHPAIRTAAGNSNGLTMLSDAYKSDESQVNIGVMYSSAKLVLSTSVKPSDTADNTFISSQDTFSARPCALTMNHQGVLAFLNTSTSATTTTDSAVSLTERFRITRDGEMLLGTAGADRLIAGQRFNSGNGWSGTLQIEKHNPNAGNNNVPFLAITAYNGANERYTGGISFNRSNSNTQGTQGAVNTNQQLGNIAFNGSDGTNFIQGAEIFAIPDQTFATNDGPASLVFATTPDGTGEDEPQERLRIDSSGNLILGNASFGSGLGQLRIINDASSAPASLALFGHNNTNDGDAFAQIQFAEQESGTAGQIKAKIEAQAVSTNERGADLVFFTAANSASSTATERLRITSGGKISYNYDGLAVSSVADVDIRTNNGVHIRGVDGNVNNANIYIGGAVSNQRKTAIIHDPVGGYCRGDLHFCLENSADLSDVDVTDSKMVIKANGNVGIQTNDPDYELDLGGTALNQDDGTEYTMRIRSNNGKTAIRVGSGGGGSRVNLMRFDGDSNPGNGIGCSGDTNAGAYGGTLVYHGDRSGNENSFAVYMDQNANAAQIEAFNIRQNGDYMHGGSSYSDRDQKENITAISGTALDKIIQLSPKTWNWKPEYHDIPTDRIFAGFIAQEVQPHIPSIVTGTDGQGDMALDYQGLLAWTIKAVTELNSKVDTLEQENIALRARVTKVDTLEQENIALRARVTNLEGE